MVAPSGPQLKPVPCAPRELQRPAVQALCLFEEDGGMTEWRHSTPLGGACTCALWRSLDGQRVPVHHMIRSSEGHRA